MLKLDNRGFHHVVTIVALVVIALVGFAGYKVSSKDRVGRESTGRTSSQASCGNHPMLETPVDLDKVTGLLYPGQTRGGQYKPHGGFRFDNSQADDITIRAPLAATLVQASRYREAGEVQILLEFSGDCGIAYRFDHILKVGPKLQAAIGSLPAPLPDDSRTHDVKPQVTVRAGDVVATAVGFPRDHNVSVDFGVYDMDHANKASQDPAYAKRYGNESHTLHAVCWFDWLKPADAAKLKALPAGSQESGKQSDYCSG